MFNDQHLTNLKRRKIYLLVKSNPGIYLRELQRTLNIPLSTLNYHVTYLVRKKILLSEKKDHILRFYVQFFDDKDKQLLSVLRQKRFRQIVYLVLTNKMVNFSFLMENLKLPLSTLSYYLNFLVKKGVFNKERIGDGNIYTVKNEGKIIRILITYKSGLIDKLVDKTLNTWLETLLIK